MFPCYALRIGLTGERKEDFPFGVNDSPLANSELLSAFEVKAIVAALRAAGHEVVWIGDGVQLLRDPWAWARRCDLVFNLAVGYRGIDRRCRVPSVLELAEIPYVGSTADTHGLVGHKYRAKAVVQAAGVPTPAAARWEDSRDTEALARLPYPVIVKPVAESSSLGIEAGRSIVHDAVAAAGRAAQIVKQFAQPALVEQFIEGREIEVPLLGWPTLGVLGVAGVAIDGALLDGAAYLTDERVHAGAYDYVVEGLGDESGHFAELARRAGRALGLRDYGRIDFRVAADGTAYFIDAAATPYVLPNSSFFAVARARGLSYPELLDAIVQTAWRRVAQSSQNSMSLTYHGER